jgi:hypothetical protein
MRRFLKIFRRDLFNWIYVLRRTIAHLISEGLFLFIHRVEELVSSPAVVDSELNAESQPHLPFQRQAT